MNTATTTGLEVRQGMSNPQAGYMVLEQGTNRILGGAGHNPHRAWVYPLNTPRGLNVLQEFAFDHPFHNGVFVGQGRVVLDGKITNFWAPAPDWRQPDNPAFKHIGELRYGEPPQIEVLAAARRVRFTYRTTWYDEALQPVLDEVRTIEIGPAVDATLCDVTSRKIASYGPLTFEANKFGTIGVRVQPQLLPPFGGQILAGWDGGLQRGTADEVVNGKPCDLVAYEAEPPGLWRFGLCLIVLANSAASDLAGPWFVRDYGMAMFNATMQQAIHLPDGASWTTALRVAAYDGQLTYERGRNWRES